MYFHLTGSGCVLWETWRVADRHRWHDISGGVRRAEHKCVYSTLGPPCWLTKIARFDFAVVQRRPGLRSVSTLRLVRGAPKAAAEAPRARHPAIKRSARPPVEG